MLYKQYEALAQATPNVHFVGRLATYKYYNMDQVVAQALTVVAKLHGERRLEVTREPVAAPAQIIVPASERREHCHACLIALRPARKYDRIAPVSSASVIDFASRLLMPAA